MDAYELAWQAVLNGIRAGTIGVRGYADGQLVLEHQGKVFVADEKAQKRLREWLDENGARMEYIN